MKPILDTAFGTAIAAIMLSIAIAEDLTWATVAFSIILCSYTIEWLLIAARAALRLAGLKR